MASDPATRRVWAAADRRRRGANGWVVSWGCQRTNRLHRLALAEKPGANTKPIRLREAPCCGQEHVVAVMPRERREGESCDLAAESIAEFTTAGGSTEPANGDSRKRITPAAILAALTTAENRSAPNVADAVGYATTGALLDKIKRNPDQFSGVEISGGGPGRPTYLRLREPVA
jgi:hypothetical protein